MSLAKIDLAKLVNDSAAVHASKTDPRKLTGRSETTGLVLDRLTLSRLGIAYSFFALHFRSARSQKKERTISDGHPMMLHSVLVRQATRHLRCHAACTGTE